jgi:hypothetical protein
MNARYRHFLVVIFLIAQAFSFTSFANSQKPIPESFYDDGYILPNESLPFHFKDAILESGKGTLVSVGTIRGWIDAGMGNFDHVVFLDINRKAVLFNQLHTEFLRALGQLKIPHRHQRYQYLATLNCGWLTSKQLETLEKFDSNPSSAYSDLFMNKLDSFLSSKAEHCRSKVFPHALRKSVSPLIRSKFVFIKAPHKTRADFSLFSAYYLHEGKIRPAYYWENDKDWIKIQYLVQNFRVTSIVGNLVSGPAFQDLTQALITSGGKLAAIDVSNALENFQMEIEYAERCDVDPESRVLREYNHFYMSLKNLPKTENAVILRTSRWNAKGFPREGELWSYISLPISKLVKSSVPNIKDWFIY